jgi:thiamine transporter ThiT
MSQRGARAPVIIVIVVCTIVLIIAIVLVLVLAVADRSFRRRPRERPPRSGPRYHADALQIKLAPRSRLDLDWTGMGKSETVACTRCLAVIDAAEPVEECPDCGAPHHPACLAGGPCLAAACAGRRAPERARALAVVLPALFAALAHVLGMVPFVRLNIEPKTLTVFLAGYVAGPGCGLLTGGLVTVLHQLFNPLGTLGLVGAFAQAAAWALVGAAGGLAGRRPRDSAVMAATGASLTLVYHVILDWACARLAGVTFWAYFAGGFAPPFYFTPAHVVSNAALFGLIVPAIEPALRRFRVAIERGS